MSPVSIVLRMAGWRRLLAATLLGVASQQLLVSVVGACTNGNGWPH